ncbi:MAG: NAD(P)/FAD-dependent oxidoreductase [Planctomycetota bacterium]
MKTPVRVTVVGAGPAGCIAALCLARGGADVTLFEKKSFPREKVCGECVSALGQDVLRRLGLPVTGCSLQRCVVQPARGRRMNWQLPRPMLGVTRGQLDTTLRNAAVDAGVTVRQPATPEGDFDHTVIATGKADRKPTGDFGVKAHFAGVDLSDDAVHLFGCRGCYGGLAPVGDGVWNFSFGVSADRLKAVRGDRDALRRQLEAENPALASAMRHAEQRGEWHASPLPRYAVARDWPAHTWPVGNAAAALEPIGGEGMGLAMRSAELAADTILNDRSPAELRARYRQLWNRRRIACRAAALVLQRPTLARIAAACSVERTPMQSPLLALMGKTA